MNAEPVTSVKLWLPDSQLGVDRLRSILSPGWKPTIVSPLASAAEMKRKVSLPVPPSITLTALLAVIVSLPEPVTMFSIPQSVSDTGLAARRRAASHEAGAEIDRDIGGDRRHVERIVALLRRPSRRRSRCRRRRLISATIMSLPLPPNTVSLPVAGLDESSPPSPKMRSAPASPKTMSASSPARTSSSPP